MKFLASLFALLFCFSTFARADRLQECLIKGWADARERVPYTLHIRYQPASSEKYETQISSLTFIINGHKIVFPKNAFSGLGVLLGTPSDVGENWGTKNDYSISFRSCGDAAKSFSLEFEVKDGRLYKRNITPKRDTELYPAVRIYDAHGKIIYDGACDKQGNPCYSPLAK